MMDKIKLEAAFVCGNIEGCLQTTNVGGGLSDNKPSTLVFLDGNLLSGIVSANTLEGWADRCILKNGHSAAIRFSDVEVNGAGELQTERLYGGVIILVCSPKILHLLQELSKNNDE